MKARHGQALIEFAIISFVLSAIVAGLLGILVLGLSSFQNNIASENAGRILDGHVVLIEENFRTHFFNDANDPFPNTVDFENVTARQVYRLLNEYPIDADGRVLYDETWLVMTPTEYFTSRDDDDNPLNVPEINLSLLGQYVFDPDLIPDGETEQGAYRFPGAVVRNAANQQTVLVPILPGPGSTGIDRTFHITSTNSDDFYPVSQDWVAPVTIGRTSDGSGFRVSMFHPSQPASTINMNIVRDAQGDIVSQAPVEADDNAVGNSIGLPPTDYTMSPAASNNPAFGASSSRGEYGLGESYAFVKTVRPFRAVFETSSVFRMGAQLNPILVKYEYAEDGNPSSNLFDGADQDLEYEQLVIDNAELAARRYDIGTHSVVLQPNDDGEWRIRVSAEFEIGGGVSGDVHLIRLELVKDGSIERVITEFNEPFVNPSELLQGEVISQCFAGEALQVRVFSQAATPGNEIRLTGNSATNWISFERVR